MGADHQFMLPEANFNFLSILAPPRVIEFVGHDIDYVL